MPQQKGKGPLFSKTRVAPAPSTQSESRRTTQSSSSQPNSFEKKLREGKLKLKKVATPVPKRSPIIPSSSDDCPICLEPMKKPNQLLTTTCCRKKFHKKCIEACKTTTCPLCRHDHLLDFIFNKLTETEKETPDIQKTIKTVINRVKTFEDRQDYDFMREVISNNRLKIIEKSVKIYIKYKGSLDDIIQHEVKGYIY